MNEDIKRLYQFLLQQMSAEAYISAPALQSNDALQRDLIAGNNRFDPDLPTGGLTRFTRAQADEFLARYEIVSPLADNPGAGQATIFNGIPLNTGFSATLLRDKADGSYTLAIRSTEFKSWADGGDKERDAAGADWALASNGFAWAQIDTMERYYAWLKSSGTLPAGATLNVTGYSLGGHLATVFTELHKGDADVHFGETVTFNAAGRGTWDASRGSIANMLALYRAVLSNPSAYVPPVDSPIFQLFLAASLATGPIDGTSLYHDARYAFAQAAVSFEFSTQGLFTLPSDPGRTALSGGAGTAITQVYGREFPNDRSLVANSGVHGPARSVFVEAQPLVAGLPPELGGSGDYGGGHSIVLIADSLALMRALNNLDDLQTIDSVAQIFVRASSRKPLGTIVGDGSTALAEFDVLENTLDALRRSLSGFDLPSTPYGTGGRGFGDFALRNGWYTNLDALTASAPFSALAGKLTIAPVRASEAGSLATAARNDFGSLVALQTFSPFVLEPKVGDSEAIATLDAAWQAAHATEYGAWQRDRAATLAQRINGEAAYSDAWYADRAAMFGWLLKANEQNLDYANNGGALDRQPIDRPMLFQDLLTRVSFTVSRATLPEDAYGVGRTIFGDSAANTIVGADAADRLYGGAGDDTIEGAEGNDYLEGNAGNDILRGGAGNDTLLGGADDDELSGGLGDDRLLGGFGADTYKFASGDGFDTILDSDGIGRVVWDGQVLSGGVRISDHVWRSADERFTYALSVDGEHETLYITKDGASGRVAVEDFSRQRGDLSILLPDTLRVVAPPVTTRDIVGDLQLLDTDPVAQGIQTGVDDIGNLLRTSAPNQGYFDTFFDSPGGDHIRAFGGADYIYAARGGSDFIEGGDGVDGISGGDGDDMILGGNDADELAGGNGSDYISGGAGDDVIMTEHEIAYDSSTYVIAVPPDASVVRVWTYDGRFATAGYVIQVVQYALEGITFESPWVGIGGFVERRDPGAHDFVDAGDGSDLVYGGYGSDVILGGDGSDRLEGSGGDDVLEGGSGNDLISGDSPLWTNTGPVSGVPTALHGNDLLFGGDGDDLLLGGGGNDVLDGGEGNDVLYGDVAGMTYAMPVGTAVLEQTPAAMHGNDILRGGPGNDRLYGEGGDDRLSGGTGDDILTGGPGADVYEYDRGDGADWIFGSTVINDGDELHFGAAISATETTLLRSGQDLQIDTGTPGDRITLKNWFTPQAEQQIAWVMFADGTRWSRDDINARFVITQTGTAQADVLNGFLGKDEIYGLDGGDTINAGGGDDLIEGGKGADILDGGHGNDRYVFRRGDGADVIVATDPLAHDVLQFVGIRREEVTFTRSGTALTVSVAGTTDRVTLSQYFANSAPGNVGSLAGVQSIEFDGGVRVEVSEIRALFKLQINGTPGSDYLAGGAGDELISGGAGNDTMYGYAGDDTLVGGDGNDYMDGGLGADLLDGGPGDDTLVSEGVIDYGRPSYLPAAYLNNGDDTFVYGRGYGRDSVSEDNPVSDPSTDRILLKDLLPADVALGRGDNGSLSGSADGDRDLIIRVRSSSDYLRVRNFFDPDPRYWIEELTFADGMTWNREQILANLAPELTASAGQDFLLGSSGSDSVDGGPGDDVIWLGDGNDRAEGGAGNDHLQGGSGADYLSGGPGDDELLGGDGADVLDGGPGDDILLGGNQVFNPDGASDTYVFRGGSGHDTILSPTRSGDSDTVFLEGLTAANVEFGWTTTNDLRIRLFGSDDILLVLQQFEPGRSSNIEWVRFGDGTAYGVAAIEAMARQNRDDFLTGTSGPDVLDGGGGNDDLRGGAGNDTLRGGPGDDHLDGETGADVMDGGPGDDFFVVDNVGDVVIEALGEGFDRVATTISFVLPQNVEGLYLLAGTINGTGNSLDNTIIGSSQTNRLDGGAGNDVLDGGAGADTMLGGPGDDTFYVDNSGDSVIENANEGTDLVISSVTRTLGANQELLRLTGSGAINGTGNGSNNLLQGNGANNVLNGAGGIDILQGAAGNDTLTDTSGRGVHDGGAGADTLTGGTDRQFFAGGIGADALTLGGGADIVAFNRGDGADTINAPTSGAGSGEKNDTLSLAGIRYEELRLAKESNDLVLRVAGTTDSIRFKGWYASASNQTTNTLQWNVDSTSEYSANGTDPLRNRRVVRLNFSNIVTAFNAAGSPADWGVPQSTLTAAFIAGSNTDALGGQLAYVYARDGSLAGIDFPTAVSVLADAGFATAPQTISTGPTNGGFSLASAAVESNARPEDWVTARPVQRYLTQVDSDDQVPPAAYLTPHAVAAALQGIDLRRSPGWKTVVEPLLADSAPIGAVARQWDQVDSAMVAMSAEGAIAPGNEHFERQMASILVAAVANPGQLDDTAPRPRYQVLR